MTATTSAPETTEASSQARPVPPGRTRSRRRLSVLDLGSNSFHVLVADVTDDGSITPVAREREMLHLGAVVARHGAVPDAHRSRAVEVVAQLTRLAVRLGVTERLAVATSALREAGNGPAVVAHMELAGDTAIRVLDGVEEARLGFKGLATAVGAARGPRLMVDLGGGSLELAVGTGGRMDTAASLPLGVSRLSDQLADDPPSPGRVAHLRGLVATAVNLLPLDRGDVGRLSRDLVRMDVDQRADVPGMKTKRADHIHVAAVIIDETLRRLDIDRLRVSDWGLREGVLLDSCAVGPTPLVALRDREVARMQSHLLDPDDIAHLDHVGGLATRLFDVTRDLHDLDDHHRDLLVAGARLHGVGRTLALRRQHQHGAYLIEHFELRGFTPLETVQLCCMARFHASKGMSTSYPPWAAMDDTAAAATAQMVALVQVADALDRARDQAITDVDVDITRERTVVLVDGAQSDQAVPEVQRRVAWFEDVFGVTVQVRTAAPRPREEPRP